MKKQIKAFLVFCDSCGKRLETDMYVYVFFKDKDMDTMKEQIEDALDDEGWIKKRYKYYCDDCDDVIQEG